MKKMTAKRGLAALMAVLMGASIFTTTGAIGVSAGGKGAGTSSVSAGSRKTGKQTTQQKIDEGKKPVRENFDSKSKLKAEVNARKHKKEAPVTKAFLIENVVTPALQKVGLKACFGYKECIAESLIALNFDEHHLTKLTDCLLEIMKQTAGNRGYLGFVCKYYFSRELPPADANQTFQKILGTLCNLWGVTPYAYDQIGEILGLIEAFVV